jgi:hypothetical protein
MKVGDLVLPDFPENRSDWRNHWPAGFPGVIIHEHDRGCYTVMTPFRTEDINIEYLVKIV